jgi:response regulator of citrate/malate metabolism
MYFELEDKLAQKLLDFKEKQEKLMFIPLVDLNQQEIDHLMKIYKIQKIEMQNLLTEVLSGNNKKIQKPKVKNPLGEKSWMKLHLYLRLTKERGDHIECL